MDWKTGFSLALDELRRHKMRTVLTMLGMVFGVAAVVSMLSVGQGAEREALSVIEAMGLRSILASAKPASDEELQEWRQRSLGLNLDDLAAAQETMPYLSGCAAVKKVDTYTVFSRFGTSDAEVLGVSPRYFQLSRLELARGRALHPLDDRHYAAVCVLGSRAARELFGGRDPIGDMVKVNHTWFTVVGLLVDRSVGRSELEGVSVPGVQGRVFVPLRTALKRFAFKPLASELDAVQLEVPPGTSVRQAAASLGRLLEVRHRGVGDYSLVVPEQLLEQNRRTRRIFNIVMSCIAGISLLVGGIGIMNIMLASVLERTWEIGIRRAIGARRTAIRRQFMVEALTISTLGGVSGVLVGVLIARAISIWSGWPVAWHGPGIVLAVVVCASVGLVFGIYPAVKASRLSPIEALRRG